MNSLQRDPEEAKEMLQQINPNIEETISFDEFI